MRKLLIAPITLFLASCAITEEPLSWYEQETPKFKESIEQVKKILPNGVDLRFVITSEIEMWSNFNLNKIQAVGDSGSLSLTCPDGKTSITYSVSETPVALCRSKQNNEYTAAASLAQLNNLLVEDFHNDKYYYASTPLWQHKKNEFTEIAGLMKQHLELQNTISKELGYSKTEYINLPIELNIGHEYKFADLKQLIIDSNNVEHITHELNKAYSERREQEQIALNERIKEARLEEERQIKMRKLKAKMRENLKKYKLEKQRELEKFNYSQRESLNFINTSNKNLRWDSKAQLKNSLPGTEICSFKENKMGFIESTSGDKYKVLWKHKVIGELDGFFFGNMSFSSMSKSKIGDYTYKTIPMTDLTWVSEEEIGLCLFGR